MHGEGNAGRQPGAGGGPAVPGFANGVQSATVTVPVKGFTCPEAEMTQHLIQAMKSGQIRGDRLQGREVRACRRSRPGDGHHDDPRQHAALQPPGGVKASGAGAALEGNARLDMTTYGVEPPVVMLGMLKVGPQIRIEFKGLVTP